MDNILRRKVENDLKHQIECRISFELLRNYGIVGLGPILYEKQITKLEELLGDDKRFYLENEYACLVVKYKDDCISILSNRFNKSNNKFDKE
jgi:hypothetical protein